MRNMKNKEHGLTLIEVLVSITILGIILTTFLSFFTQSYSYTKKNQNKTVGINIARNVLYFMEQQNYDSIKTTYFSKLPSEDEVTLSIKNCEDSPFTREVCEGFFSSKINNVDYAATVKLTRDVNDDVTGSKPDLTPYLIGVEVEVEWEKQNAKVRGLIKK